MFSSASERYLKYTHKQLDECCILSNHWHPLPALKFVIGWDSFLSIVCSSLIICPDSYSNSSNLNWVTLWHLTCLSVWIRIYWNKKLFSLVWTCRVRQLVRIVYRHGDFMFYLNCWFHQYIFSEMENGFPAKSFMINQNTICGNRFQ